MNRKPIIGIIGKPVEYMAEFLWHQVTCYDETRYLVVKNGGIAIELLPTQPKIEFVDVEKDYTNIKNQDMLSKEELEDIDRQIEMCDGIIVQGGVMTCTFEIEIIKKALEKDLPIIGICAGFNNILRALGGDVKEDNSRSHDHFTKDYRHNIKILKDSKLYEMIGKENLEVNSLHFMIAPKENVEKFAKITSYSDDGLVESFEVPGKKFAFGFKWHPELMIEEIYVDKIFKEFIKNCKD